MTLPATPSGATAPAAPPVDVVVLAAGKGTRMKSRTPKVLHRLGGRPLLHHVLGLSAQIGARSVVVVTGHGAPEVEASCDRFALESQGFSLKYVRQEPQRGTGHAVQQAVPVLADDGRVLVLSGDVPLTRAQTLQALLAVGEGGARERLALLTVQLNDPTGYGRIVRGEDGAVRAIVEEKDATPAQRAIAEVYSGILVAPARWLKTALARLSDDNAQREYYLTDVVKFAVADGLPVLTHRCADPVEVAGVNSPAQLAELERALQQRQAQALMAQGVRLADPARIDLRGELHCAQDVEIDVNCVFEGRVELGEGVRIGANCVIANARIAAGAVIHPFCHIDGEAQGVQVGEGARIGPFARLRPGAVLGAEVHVGNFVEVKNATLADGAKANHLAYLGDASVGARVNYGAGAITANYDGANKHRTVIGDDVHVGSNAVLVAPVALGAGATVGAGSVITKDVPEGALAVTRARQTTVAGWERPRKNKAGN
ncbi:bifunctional UDP-N-acetylglucosamine diphosphorylase/glucosamine-1-phosphate N-acetyltransferase GlmU [Tibeticola sp.]|uniref:bifunctional UDP-N-acetylglucosamine diphosphorylase/glucosamine-1-phosphate N-acetyltransferase GlmU n=1 Tax=Tibeticola sp. TaxID=2005368 RepID=UPI0025D1FE88|nr:bifunctional UDP-N-acetylglucosamine diphosphorylase/glucosamine-1-phosphate N-acetyltransferase GlmU [Tibeticola sp.]